MGEKRVSLRHEGGLRFVASSNSDDDFVAINGRAGTRPTDLLLAAIASCSAMDVVEIMAKKRQTYERYSAEIWGTQRAKAPNVFTDITLVHIVEGNVETEALRRSIELSATKYCTVSAQVASGVARVSHRYVIRRPGAEEESGEVVVTGPMRDFLSE